MRIPKRNNSTHPMTIFSRIIAGEIPSYKCAEDDRFYAFLDINPVAKGHTLSRKWTTCLTSTMKPLRP